MAQRRKTQTLNLSKNGKVIVGIIVAMIALFCFLADKGIINTRKIKQMLGSADSPAVDAQMSVHFIDVGQGDCTLVVSDGEAMLIDAGETVCGVTVADYLDSMGITKLKYVIGTHPHSDHIGGLSYIIENVEVETVIMPQLPDDIVPTTTVYENLLETISENNLKIRAARDEVLTLGTSKVEIFAPLGDYSNLNNYSVCAKITHGENTFLFTGDTEETAEKNFVMRCGNSLDAKVLKMGHHGSDTATYTELLDVVNPRYAVVSCGENNKYGHPHQDALDRVEKYADYILRTDLSGTIIFESDGEGLSVIDASGNNLLEE